MCVKHGGIFSTVKGQISQSSHALAPFQSLCIKLHCIALVFVAAQDYLPDRRIEPASTQSAFDQEHKGNRIWFRFWSVGEVPAVTTSRAMDAAQAIAAVAGLELRAALQAHTVSVAHRTSHPAVAPLGAGFAFRATDRRPPRRQVITSTLTRTILVVCSPSAVSKYWRSTVMERRLLGTTA
jgi:hypothetical protein